jgi:glucose/arabinose dehydrogenase
MRTWLLAAAALLLFAAPASAAPELVEIGSFGAPVHVASPPNDPRVFVVEQGGTVKIAGGGTFVDLTGPTLSGGERGLLSIAFPPDYATSGLFYVFMTSEPDGDVEVREYRRSAADPNVADPTPVRTLLDEPHSATNHNGGQLQFGPDGALYARTPRPPRRSGRSIASTRPRARDRCGRPGCATRGGSRSTARPATC